MTGFEAFIAKEAAGASRGLLAALVQALVTGADKKLRGTPQERRLKSVVADAIAASVDVRASSEKEAMRKHAVAVLKDTAAPAEIAAMIVAPPAGSGGVEVSWIAEVRDRLLADGVDLETLPIDLDRFVSRLPDALMHELQIAGNESDSPLADLVTHIQLARTQVAIEQLPSDTAREIGDAVRRDEGVRRTTELASYRQAVRAAGDALPYLAIRRRLGSHGAPRKLSEIYIPQRLSLQSRKVRPFAVRADSGCSIEDVLAEHERIVVVGPGGQGKSTLLRRICATLDDSSQLVPILVSAQQLASRRAGWPSRLSKAIDNELGHTVPPDLFTEPPTPDATWLLLVDGLDEVASVDRRAELIDDLVRLGQGDAPFRVAVTTRAIGDLDRLVGERFSPFSLLPISEEDVQQFAHNWFSPSTPQQLDRTRAFLRWLERASVPYHSSGLLLTMAALVFERPRDHGTPATGRAALYDELIALLLEDAEDDRPVYESFERLWTRRLPARGAAIAAGLWERRRGLLEHLAYWRQTDRDGDVVAEALAEARRHELLAHDLRGPWLAEQMRTLLSRTGLIAGHPTFEFVHESLREYLAACELCRRFTPEAFLASNSTQSVQSTGDLLPFAIHQWCSRQVDPSPVLRELLDMGRGGVELAATAVADGAALSPDLAQDILSRTVSEWASGHSSLAFRLSFNHNWVLRRLLWHEDARNEVRSLITSERRTPRVRSQAVELLGMEAGEATLLDLLAASDQPAEVRLAAARVLWSGEETALTSAHLTAMLEDPSLSVGDRAEIASLLVRGGSGPPEATQTLLDIGGSTVFDSRAWNAVASGLVAMDRREALSTFAQDPELPSSARLIYARELLEQGAEEEALAGARSIVANGEVDDHMNAASILGRAGDTETAIATIENAISQQNRSRSAAIYEMRAWAQDRDLLRLMRAPDTCTEARLELADALAGGELARQAMTVLEELAGDDGLGDNERVNALIRLSRYDESDDWRERLVSIARDPSIDTRARVAAAKSVECRHDSESASIALLLLRDPGVEAGSFGGLAQTIAEAGDHRDLHAILDDPSIDILGRIAVASALAACGTRDRSSEFLWNLIEDVPAHTSTFEDAASALIGLREGPGLLEWAATPHVSASVRLAIAKKLLYTPSHPDAEQLLDRVLSEADQLDENEGFEAGKLLAEAGMLDIARRLAFDPATTETLAQGAVAALVRLGRVNDVRTLSANVAMSRRRRRAAAVFLHRSLRPEETRSLIVALSETDTVQALLSRGGAFERCRLFDDAAADYRAVALDEQADARARCLAATGLSRANSIDEAQAILVDLIEDKTTPSEVMAAAAKTLGSQGFHEMHTTPVAVRLLARCVEDDSLAVAVRSAAAKALGSAAAAEHLRETDLDGQVEKAATDPDTPAAVRSALTKLLIELGHPNDASVILLRIASDPEQPESLRRDATRKLRQGATSWREPLRKAVTAALRELRANPAASQILAVELASSRNRGAK